MLTTSMLLKSVVTLLISILNSVFAGYTEGIFYDGYDAASGNYLSGKSVFANNLILGSNGKSNQLKASSPAALALISVGINADNIFTPASYGSAVYSAPYKYSADVVVSEFQGVPNFTQIAGSPALTGAAFTNAKVADAFFEKVAYKGAVGDNRLDCRLGYTSTHKYYHIQHQVL